MTSINSLLFSVQNQAPALLGTDRTTNYNNLAALSGSLWGESQNSLTGDASSSGSLDAVSLAFQRIGDRVVNDLASVTAEAIKTDPSLENDYLIAIIDNGASREARVFRRSEILAGFEGGEAEKKALSAQLAANPLMVFSQAGGLPAGSGDAGCAQMADDLNAFLKTMGKTVDSLKNAGYDPFASYRGSNAVKSALAALGSGDEA